MRDSRRGFAKAIERAQAYDEAGADLVFVEALETVDEMRDACKEIDKPMVANMATGGKTPILNSKQLQELGFAMAIFPALGSLVAAAALEKAYRHLNDEGDSVSPDMDVFSFDEFNRLIGFPAVWDFDKKWAR